MEFIDKIYIINLPEATNRWENCLEQLNKYNITNYERVNGHKINNINDINKDYLFNLKKKGFPTKTIIGSYGCKLSHLEIMKSNLNNLNKNILVLEDDFIIKENFIENLKKNINDFKKLSNYKTYKILYFGLSYFKNFKKTKIINNIYNVQNAYGGFAYLINTNYINDLYNHCINNNIEIDINIRDFCSSSDIYAFIPNIITHSKQGYSYIRQKNRIHNNLL